MQNRVSLEDLCQPNAKPGYTLDMYTCVPVREKSITEAVELVHQNIEQQLKKIENGSGCQVTDLYVGKTYIRYSDCNCECYDENGVNNRFRYHVKKPYGQNGLIVVAWVTRESIPPDCVYNGYITHQEEYVLTLETRLIEKYQEDRDCRLGNIGTSPGRTDKGNSPAYVIYVAFTLREPQFGLFLHIPNTSLVRFGDLCQPYATPGYAIDTCELITDLSITEAAYLVNKNIEERLEAIENGSGCQVTKISIGSTYMDRYNRGVDSHYRYHVKRPYGKNGLLVVGVVTKDSIPSDCLAKGYITHQAEYVRTLERRLVQKCTAAKDKWLHCATLLGKLFTAYNIYVTFTLSEQRGY